MKNSWSAGEERAKRALLETTSTGTPSVTLENFFDTLKAGEMKEC